jgi:hypothetical protein
MAALPSGKWDGPSPLANVPFDIALSILDYLPADDTINLYRTGIRMHKLLISPYKIIRRFLNNARNNTDLFAFRHWTFDDPPAAVSRCLGAELLQMVQDPLYLAQTCRRCLRWDNHEEGRDPYGHRTCKECWEQNCKYTHVGKSTRSLNLSKS